MYRFVGFGLNWPKGEENNIFNSSLVNKDFGFEHVKFGLKLGLRLDFPRGAELPIGGIQSLENKMTAELVNQLRSYASCDVSRPRIF